MWAKWYCRTLNRTLDHLGTTSSLARCDAGVGRRRRKINQSRDLCKSVRRKAIPYQRLTDWPRLGRPGGSWLLIEKDASSTWLRSEGNCYTGQLWDKSPGLCAQSTFALGHQKCCRRGLPAGLQDAPVPHRAVRCA
jgi:hypothetical protein